MGSRRPLAAAFLTGLWAWCLPVGAVPPPVPLFTPFGAAVQTPSTAPSVAPPPAQTLEPKPDTKRDAKPEAKPAQPEPKAPAPEPLPQHVEPAPVPLATPTAPAKVNPLPQPTPGPPQQSVPQAPTTPPVSPNPSPSVSPTPKDPGLKAPQTTSKGMPGAGTKPRPSQGQMGLVGQVAVLRSPATLKLGGWRAEWELAGSVETLKQMGLSVVVLDEKAFRVKGCPCKVLILPNVRNLDLQTVQKIHLYAASGLKVLATYQSSYRRPDNSSWNPNNLALGRELGVRFFRWSGGNGECTQIEGSGLEKAQIMRHQAMLVHPLAGSKVLANWDRPEKSPAIVEGPSGIYCGEDLLAPENGHSYQVRVLLSQLLGKLDPSLHFRISESAKPLAPPKMPPTIALQGAQIQIRVGLGSYFQEAQESHNLRLRLRAHQGRLSLGAGRTCLEAVLSADGICRDNRPAEPWATVDNVTVKPQSNEAGQNYIDAIWENSQGACSWSAYRGTLEFTPKRKNVSEEPSPESTGVSVVNRLPLDSYICGVVPSEVPSSFPAEALKAMALVARTFCLSHLDRHRKEAFDVCSEVHCQVYRGLAQESAPTNQAVLQTQSEIVTFEGKPADTTFHACCGGYGVDAEAAWPSGGTVAYLRGLPDFDGLLERDLGNSLDLENWLSESKGSFCSKSGRYRWEETYRWSDLEARLEQSLPRLIGKDYHGLGALQSFQVQRRDVSGRVSKLQISGEQGTYQLGGDQVRWITSAGRIGSGGLNSSLFVLKESGSGSERSVKILGAGWGHGVGLCQEGAAGRALAGQDYRTILLHYYPGSKISKAPPSNGPGISRRR